MIIDFEGEPARPLPERRQKRSPLRDVASMLRSFAYVDARRSSSSAAAAAPADFEQRAREQFLEHYFAAVDPTLLPGGEAGIDNLLSIFELEKAIYELRYELNNRPDWIRSRSPASGASGGRMTVATSELEPLVRREHSDPHRVLGAHPQHGGVVVPRASARRPSAVVRLPTASPSRRAQADPPAAASSRA